MDEKNAILEKVCSIRSSFDRLMEHYSTDTEFTDSVKGALDAADFPDVDKIRQEYQKHTNSARLLKIGIVGAVKAGKSSLLNSLFFDGHDILPKAATPMTAALTEITWGEKCSVTVDFFTDQDIDELKRKSAEYERRFAEIKSRKNKEMEENWLKAQKRRNPMFSGNPGAKEREQWEKSSESAAQTDLRKNMLLSGAWEQYQMISKSPVQRKTGSESLAVGSVSEISGCLQDYVGADGKYMPFTSKVSITLPLESLKGIAVVDTPGFNDPVPSRDERARLALRECDAVFILSRATPFLTDTDMEVISKITQKNGLREIFIVPSQVDGTLIAPEHIRNSNRDMNVALGMITKILSKVVRNNFSDPKRNVNDGGVFDQLINEASDRMFLTSGICESMSRTFAERDSWDSGKRKVWENLCKQYPDFFSDSDEETSIASLKKLGNTENIRRCIEDVKSRKEEIFKDRLQKFGIKYVMATKDVSAAIIRELEAREAEIKKNDIGQTEAMIEKLQRSYNTIAPQLDDVFLDTVSDWYDQVKSECQSALSGSRENVKAAMQSQEGETIHRWVEEQPWWKFWADDIQHSETLTTVNASAVKNAIYDYVEEYNDFLPHFFEEQVRRLVKKVINNVNKVWTDSGIAIDDSSASFRNRVKSAIPGLVRDYDLEYHGRMFSYSGSSSKLEGYAAEECIDQSRDFVSGLNRTFKETLKEALGDVYRQCRNCDFSKNVLDPYLKQLEKKKADMEKPKLALENFRRMKEEVRAIK